MGEWSKDHVAVIGSLNLNLDLIDGLLLNWRQGRPLGGKWRPLARKVGEWFVES
jgi:hypothetical protein